MKREDLLNKGYSEEQTTEILNMFHDQKKQLDTATSEIETYKNQVSDYKNQLDEINRANMSEQERLEAERKEIAKNLSDSRKMVNKAMAKEILAGLNVDEQLINNLVSDDENATINNANLLKSTLARNTESVAEATKAKLANIDPKPPASNVTDPNAVATTMTKENFFKMGMAEQAKWKTANPQEFKQLFGGE